tara:strand:+ start:2112 stop:3179 length:1068 start_codon:yes stop_codon:yes gene_type:complete
MQFFDDKQDVFDIVVTPYGESLLAKGLFDPAYYAFFDDDILYDAEWAGITTEVQNDIEGRIQQGTPRMRPPSVYTGVETAIGQINADIRAAISGSGLTDSTSVVQDTLNNPIYNQDGMQNYGDKFEFLSKPLGRSALTSKKHPSWSLSMLQGEISSSQNYSETETGFENIPQINIDLSYKLYVSETGDPAIQFNNATAEFSSVLFPVGSGTPQSTAISDVIPPTEFQNIISQVFQDQTYFSLTDGRILIDILEENVDFKKENFDIQVFMSGSSVNGANGAPVQLLYGNQVTNMATDEVEKYLTIRVDREITDARVSDLPQITENRLVADPSVTNVISTREFLLRDLYDPEPDICD